MVILDSPFANQFFQVLNNKVFFYFLEKLTLFVVNLGLSVLCFIM